MNFTRKLDYAERWLQDGVNICRVPSFFVSVEVDMSSPRAMIEDFSRRGIRLTYVHVIVQAGAQALARNPELHRMICGNRVYEPKGVTIGLSVAGELPVAPLLLIEGAEEKDIAAIAREIAERAPQVRQADREMIAKLRRWGWLVPFGFLRRSILRLLFRNAGFRIHGSGTLQVSVLSQVETLVSPVFSTSAALFAGGVQDKAVAVDGTVTVRPMMTLACSADHRVWDGRASEKFLVAVREILQTGVKNPLLNSFAERVREAKATRF